MEADLGDDDSDVRAKGQTTRSVRPAMSPVDGITHAITATVAFLVGRLSRLAPQSTMAPGPPPTVSAERYAGDAWAAQSRFEALEQDQIELRRRILELEKGRP
jgi:hypothetical protein